MTKPRILLVEDEEAMIAGLEYALAKEGFEVSTARDGAVLEVEKSDADGD